MIEELSVKGGLLMWIFSVAQIHPLGRLDFEAFRKAGDGIQIRNLIILLV